MKNKQKGITIIALIVTIVVLLILAGITIGMLTGDNGLIKKSKQAKEQTEIANEKEILEQAIVQSMKKYEYGEIKAKNLQEALDNLIGENTTVVIEESNDIIVEFKNNEKYYLVTDEGETKEYDYLSSLSYYIKSGEIKVGDYFEYCIKNYKNNGIYTVTAEKSGYTLDQEYDAKSYQGQWRVLYDGTDDNGIQIVSCENVLGEDSEGKLNLCGREGYNNLVEILNIMSGNYVEKDYAYSARSLGSNPKDIESSIGNTTTIREVKETLPSAVVWDLVQDDKWEDENYKYDEEQLKSFQNNKYKGDIFYASRLIFKGYHYGGDADLAIRKYNKVEFGVGNEVAIINGNGSYQKMVSFAGFIPVIKLKETLTVNKVEEGDKVIWEIKVN